jgi:hypothetical protein
MKLKHFTCVILSSCQIAVAQNSAPIQEPSSTYPVKSTSSTDASTVRLLLTNIWKYDNSVSNNPINFNDKYPQLTTQILVYNSHIYIPKFKTEFPSAQKLYIFNAVTGEPETENGVEVEGLGKDSNDGFLPFESILSNQVEPDNLYMVGAPNARISDESYKNNLIANPRIAWYNLDLTDALKPKATLFTTEYLYDEEGIISAWDDLDKYSPLISRLSYSGFCAQRKQENYYGLLGCGLSSDDFTDLLKTYKSSTSDQNSINRRSSFFIDIFVNEYSNFSKAYKPHFIEGKVIYDGDDTKKKYHTKFQFQPLDENYYSLSAVNFHYLINFTNKSGESDVDYGPHLFTWRSTLKKVSNEALGLDETSQIGGDAIHHFTLNDKHYLIYASKVTSDKTFFKLVYLPDWDDSTPSLSNAQEMWQIPAEGFKVNNPTDGESITYVTTSKTTENDSEVVNIYLYAQGQALAAYSLKETSSNTGIIDMTADKDNIKLIIKDNYLIVSGNNDLSINIYNTLGSLVLSSLDNNIDLSKLTTGIYIAKCGSKVVKFRI